MAEKDNSWFWLAPVGLILTGLGLSVTLEAAGRKWKGAPAGNWFPLGTLGLAIFNSGIAVFGDAVRRRSAHE